ncbi:MAG: hypothetical protein KR126chlam5_00965 [Candidatus Anoxychlamydiales bacterium]|nr:hypothetical protein [Candidatus Anoxychlamydiales bacterium]
MYCSNDLIVFDLTKNGIAQEIPKGRFLKKISNTSFSILNENTIERYSLDEREKKPFKLKEKHELKFDKDKYLYDFSFLSNGHILFFLREKIDNEDMKVSIFITDNKSYVQLTEAHSINDINFCEVEIEIDGKVQLCLAKAYQYSRDIRYWNCKTGENFKDVNKHSGDIKSLIKLRDNSLISRVGDHQVKIFDFTKDEKDKNYYEKTAQNSVLTLQELFDGSVAVQSINSIEFISPTTTSNDDVDLEELSVDALKARLRQSPQDFETYKCLAY